MCGRSSGDHARTNVDAGAFGYSAEIVLPVTGRQFALNRRAAAGAVIGTAVESRLGQCFQAKDRRGSAPRGHRRRRVLARQQLASPLACEPPSPRLRRAALQANPASQQAVVSWLRPIRGRLLVTKT